MNPRDVNRINYNNYYVGQNLDFLVRSKMRSESLTTPLKNTPPFYDDQVTSKMSLLGKRGYYDPGYIYGFSNSSQNQENYHNSPNKNKIDEDYSNPILTREQYDQIILPKEHYKEQQNMKDYEANNNNLNNNYHKYNNNERNINNNRINDNYNNNRINDNLDYNINKNNNNININRNNNNYKDEMLYNERIKMLQERQTPQKLDNFQLERTIQNNQRNPEEGPNNNRKYDNDMEQRKNEDESNYRYELDEERKYYEQLYKNNNGMERNIDKIPNKDYYKEISEYNYINELSKKNVGDFVLPLTRNQILQGVLTENFNKKNFSK